MRCLLSLGFVLLLGLFLAPAIAAEDYSLFTESGGVEGFVTEGFFVESLGVDPGVYSLFVEGGVSGLSDLEEPVDFGFEYRKVGDSEWNEVFVESRTSDGEFQTTIDGLEEGTEYEVRARSLEHDVEGEILEKHTISFSTESGGVEGFVTEGFFVESLGVDPGVYSLFVEGGVSGLSDLDEPIDLGFEYRKAGETEWDRLHVGDTTESTSFDGEIAGLEDGTGYEFKAFAGSEESEIDMASTIDEDLMDEGGVVGFDTFKYFRPDIGEVDESLEGEVVGFEVFVENEKEDLEEQEVSLDVEGLGADQETVELDSGETAVINFEIQTEEGDAGSYTANASTEGDYDVKEFDVVSLEPPINTEPEDGEEDVSLESNLSVEADASADIGMNIQFFIGKEGEDTEFVGEKQDVATGEVAEISLDSYDLEPGTAYDWFASADSDGIVEESKVFGFTTETIGIEDVQFELVQGDQDNLDYGGADIGENYVVFETSFEPEDQTGDVGVDLHDGGIEMVEAENGETVEINVSQFDLTPNEQYGFDLVYVEDGEVVDTFSEEGLEFTTYVVDLDWDDASPGDTEDFVVYYSGEGPTGFEAVGSTLKDGEVKVANLDLGSGFDECYRVAARNVLLEEGSLTEEECLGEVP